MHFDLVPSGGWGVTFDVAFFCGEQWHIFCGHCVLLTGAGGGYCSFTVPKYEVVVL